MTDTDGQATPEPGDGVEEGTEETEFATPATWPDAIVLDAGPMIALAAGEEGAEIVQSAIDAAALGETTIYAHAANLLEVFYHYHRLSDKETARAVLESLAADGVQRREDLDEAFCEDAGELKSQWRRVSLADCCGVALAQRLSAAFYTTDRHELEPLDVAGVAEIVFIR